MHGTPPLDRQASPTWIYPRTPGASRLNPERWRTPQPHETCAWHYSSRKKKHSLVNSWHRSFYHSLIFFTLTWLRISLVTSMLGLPGNGVIISYILFQSWAHIFPKRGWGGKHTWVRTPLTGTVGNSYTQHCNEISAQSYFSWCFLHLNTLDWILPGMW